MHGVDGSTDIILRDGFFCTVLVSVAKIDNAYSLRAAVWLIGKPAGWYDMLDVLGLEDAEGAGS